MPRPDFTYPLPSDGPNAVLREDGIESGFIGNGYTKTLLCFMQLFILSNRVRTYYFANNNARHFAFNADKQFLPIYMFADEDNKKITHLFGFTGTPIFEKHATVEKIDGEVASLLTTQDLCKKKLHAYTNTHAIEDGNVLRFHIDYFKREDKNLRKPGDASAIQQLAIQFLLN